MKFILITFCAFTLILTSYKKDGNKESKPAGSYSFTMGGEKYSGFAGGAYTRTADDIILTIAGGSSSDPATMQPFGITIEFPGTEAKTGTYASELFSYGQKYIGSVTVIVTTLTATRAEGTFTGSASDPGTGQTLNIEDGKFNVSVLQ